MTPYPSAKAGGSFDMWSAAAWTGDWFWFLVLVSSFWFWVIGRGSVVVFSCLCFCSDSQNHDIFVFRFSGWFGFFVFWLLVLVFFGLRKPKNQNAFGF